MEPVIINLDLLDKLLVVVSIVLALRFVDDPIYCAIGILVGTGLVAYYVVIAPLYTKCSITWNQDILDSLREFSHCLPFKSNLYFKAGWILFLASIVGYIKISVLHLYGSNKKDFQDTDTE